MLPSDTLLSRDALALLALSFRPVTVDLGAPGILPETFGQRAMPGTHKNPGQSRDKGCAVLDALTDHSSRHGLTCTKLGLNFRRPGNINLEVTARSYIHHAIFIADIFD